MPVSPYLFFDGRCEEAIEFYKKALGAKVTALMRFKDNPEPVPSGTYPPGTENKVLHANMHVGGTEIMLSDGFAKGNPEFKGFSLTITATDAAEAARFFKALGDGGKVHMPLGKTFFSPCFGMVADPFGVGWMVLVLP